MCYVSEHHEFLLCIVFRSKTQTLIRLSLSCTSLITSKKCFKYAFFVSFEFRISVEFLDMFGCFHLFSHFLYKFCSRGSLLVSSYFRPSVVWQRAVSSLPAYSTRSAPKIHVVSIRYRTTDYRSITRHIVRSSQFAFLITPASGA